MTATLFSLIAVTVGFALLVAWVYWPSRKSKLEALGEIPLDSDTEVETEKPNE
jgi:cbb3-type cytochrome oxidase subunit 3